MTPLVGVGLACRSACDPSPGMTVVARVVAPVSGPHSSGPLAGLRALLAAPVRSRTYRRLLYLAVSFPLGVVHFTALVTGLALGVGLLVLWAGLPVLVFTVRGARRGLAAEVSLARRLVGTEPPERTGSAPDRSERPDAVPPPGAGALDALRRLVADGTTWRALAHSLFRFAYGTVALVALVTGVVLPLVLVATPLIYDAPGVTVGLARTVSVGPASVGPYVVESTPAAVGVAAVGLVAGLVSVALLDRLAALGARVTVALASPADAG